MIKNAVFWDVMLCGSYITDVSEERINLIIRVKRISELGTTLAVTSMMMAVIISCET
jgi:hypothetical protein